MDRFGRRWTVLIGACINLLGAALQTGAQNLGMILAGRILAGWAVGLMSMSVPVYQSECAHPRIRGMPLYNQLHICCECLQATRIYGRSDPADDRHRFHRLHMGRLWRLQSP
jgi:hypothetical protein